MSGEKEMQVSAEQRLHSTHLFSSMLDGTYVRNKTGSDVSSCLFNGFTVSGFS